MGYQKPAEEVVSEQCNGSVYIGLGLQLGNVSDPRSDEKKEFTPWIINNVAGGYVADRNNIQSGDIFLGIKDDKGVFWEGNTLIAKGMKAGIIVDAMFRQKNKVVTQKMRLEEICYEAKTK